MIHQNLTRQHKELYKLLSEMKSLGYNIESNADKIALNINLLAGKINIHLQSEDKYLYSLLLNSASPEARKTAKHFIAEMGHISKTFNDFKLKFNTKNKILKNINEFKIEYPKVMDAIFNRLNKEDKNLYILIK
ncbi:hemerythrin domain-containing protein [Paraclostridium bifermentans]|uniref:hemerythrin domain-containing protein n=1 Tax=Paraclostridium bifermentans TaxID=1490 RepID=UPI001FF58667|nr:hemerythrin domain-containing protein [Paraclostridium bifermentans]UOW69555.1 hemerythrin domain-containing protein [Paraclostridium bifermentans]